VAFQSATQRDAEVVPVGLQPQSGKADDALRLDGFAAGATAWLRFGEKFPVGFRLGAGALIGRVRDERAGTYAARNGATLEPPDVADQQSATYFYIHPEVSLGFRLSPKFELGAGIGSMMLIAPREPRWDNKKQFFTGVDGVATYPNDRLTGGFVFTIVPAIRARYDF